MRRVLISTKPFIFVLFPVGVTVRSAESLSSPIPLGTSTERANSKRANHGRSRLLQDAVSSVSFWLQSFPVCGWRTRSLSSVSGPPTRWSCIRGWLMRLLWAYEHDFAAISPFLYERIGTLCRHPCWSLWLEQRIAGWRSGSLWALPVSPCVHEGCRGRPYPVTGSGRQDPQLPRRLAYPSPIQRAVGLIWSRFGEAQVDLFASPESSHCQLYFSLTEGPLGTDALAHSWPRALRKYAFPPVSLLAQTLCKLREDLDLVSRTHFPRDSTSLAHSSEEGPPFSGARHHMAPASRSMEPPCVAPGRDAADLSGLPPAVVETIIQARAPSTRQTYALKWSLFATWCSSRREDPRRCMIGVVLYVLQERLDRRLSPSTLKVYVAAIVAHHDAVDGRSLGKHDLIVRFLKGARRMNPSRPPLVPSWDLSIVLAGLQRGPFEPLDSVELKFLSL